jgi:hypothetical protein
MGYRVGVNDIEHRRLRRSLGLCADCEHAQRVQSSHQSTFYLCQRSATDPSFPKYPRLPVIACDGYIPVETAAPVPPSEHGQ